MQGSASRVRVSLLLLLLVRAVSVSLGANTTSSFIQLLVLLSGTLPVDISFLLWIFSIYTLLLCSQFYLPLRVLTRERSVEFPISL